MGVHETEREKQDDRMTRMLNSVWIGDGRDMLQRSLSHLSQGELRVRFVKCSWR